MYTWGTLIAVALIALIWWIFPEPTSHSYSITLVEPTVSNGRITTSGRTDLPDGTLLVYSILHREDGDGGKASYAIDGMTEVSRGSFRFQEEIPKEQVSGHIEVWVAFQTVLRDGREQPRELLAKIGNNGQTLQGANVTTYDDGNAKRIEVRLAVPLP